MKIVGVVACTSKIVKYSEHLPFCRELAYFVLKIELLLTVLSNFESKTALKDSAF